MRFYFGRYHEEDVECGLCEFVAKDSEYLEIYLPTYASYIYPHFYSINKFLPVMSNSRRNVVTFLFCFAFE